MPGSLGRRQECAAIAAAVSVALLLTGVGSALAIEQPTEAQILDALKARRLTRCPHTFISGCGETQFGRSGEKPIIDMEIPFGYASAIVDAEAMSKLTTLSGEVGKPELKGAVFLVVGHTDAKGGITYNQRLSERRAATVKRALIRKFKLPADMVVTIGYGKTQPKNTADPFAGENRRVRIVSAEMK